MRGKVRLHRYQHNNMDSLEKFLSAEELEAPKLVVTDGVFSMEGDIVKLPRLKELCKKYKARLYLDEAHGLASSERRARLRRALRGHGDGRRDHVHVLQVVRVTGRVRGRRR